MAVTFAPLVIARLRRTGYRGRSSGKNTSPTSSLTIPDRRNPVARTKEKIRWLRDREELATRRTCCLDRVGAGRATKGSGGSSGDNWALRVSGDQGISRSMVEDRCHGWGQLAGAPGKPGRVIPCVETLCRWTGVWD
jgi:hypothetical protein